MEPTIRPRKNNSIKQKQHTSQCPLLRVDFVLFLERCKKSLKPNGVIVIKENVMSQNAVHNFLVDKDDSSVTRSDNIMRNIFFKAGLKIIKVEKQKNFPANMFPVLTYGLIPTTASLN